MTHRPSLRLFSLALLALAGSAGPVWATAGSPAPAAAADKARCIVHHLPLGAQMYRASDGSIRVRTAGRRGASAQWTIGEDGTVSQSGGKAGLARTLTGTCY